MRRSPRGVAARAGTDGGDGTGVVLSGSASSAALAALALLARPSRAARTSPMAAASIWTQMRPSRWDEAHGQRFSTMERLPVKVRKRVWMVWPAWLMSASPMLFSNFGFRTAFFLAYWLSASRYCRSPPQERMSSRLNSNLFFDGESGMRSDGGVNGLQGGIFRGFRSGNPPRSPRSIRQTLWRSSGR